VYRIDETRLFGTAVLLSIRMFKIGGTMRKAELLGDFNELGSSIRVCSREDKHESNSGLRGTAMRIDEIG